MNFRDIDNKTRIVIILLALFIPAILWMITQKKYVSEKDRQIPQQLDAEIFQKYKK